MKEESLEYKEFSVPQFENTPFSLFKWEYQPGSGEVGCLSSASISNGRSAFEAKTL